MAEAKALTISLFLYLWLSYKNCLFSMKRAKERKINDKKQKKKNKIVRFMVFP